MKLTLRPWSEYGDVFYRDDTFACGTITLSFIQELLNITHVPKKVLISNNPFAGATRILIEYNPLFPSFLKGVSSKYTSGTVTTSGSFDLWVLEKKYPCLYLKEVA